MQQTCPYCNNNHSSLRNSNQPILKVGFFKRKSDRKRVQRYKCTRCLHYFSSSTITVNYGQKKRHINQKIALQLSTCTSQRETARLLKVNRKTVARKLKVLGMVARRKLKTFNQNLPKCTEIQFDDMETFEHTKCKPVSITLAVKKGDRRILDFQIAQMPSKGLLAKRSLKKYGYRADHRPIARQALLKNLTQICQKHVIIQTDQNPHYIHDIKKYFPKGLHLTYKGRRGCVVGQGELKSGGYDPLFSLNHTAAMARYKLSTLVRRTWCTTKKIERLQDLFAIFSLQHNLRLKLQT